MGDCASRLDKKEIEIHLSETNNKNNNYFKCIPSINTHSEFLIHENNLSTLETRKSFYSRKKREFTRKFEESTVSVPAIKEIVIEVQKGIYLTKPGLCFLKGKPYVAVSLEPNGPCYETFEADIHKPVWYRIFQNKSLIDYQVVSVTVKSDDDNHQIGSVNILISDISDQNVHEKWYNLSQQGDQKPAIKLRIQYIHNEKKLYKDLADTCDRLASEVSERITILQA